MVGKSQGHKCLILLLTVFRPPLSEILFSPSFPLSQSWTLEKDGAYGAVQCLDNYDITGDGVKDLIVGKHDGGIDVYQYEDGEELEPQLKFSHVRKQRIIVFSGE